MREGGRWPPWISCSLVGSQWNLSFYILCAVRLSISIFGRSELAVLVLLRFFCCCEFIRLPAFSLLWFARSFFSTRAARLILSSPARVLSTRAAVGFHLLFVVAPLVRPELSVPFFLIYLVVVAAGSWDPFDFSPFEIYLAVVATVQQRETSLFCPGLVLACGFLSVMCVGCCRNSSRYSSWVTGSKDSRIRGSNRSPAVISRTRPPGVRWNNCEDIKYFLVDFYRRSRM
jgi:hypothetical protein